MQRSHLGIIFIITGSLIFIVSLVMLLNLSDLYLPSLFIMFISVVEIAVGFAYARGVDKSLDIPSENCYYCEGTGIIDKETCPRCGGTGLARNDD
ncbi:hypothetical protein EU527_04070 [Candidatus Thorarchaeota archaeon]|nr:MAG: hypothetical protein EU527_04070 [Candidatus Thorarchaeota archaeon]